MHSNGLLQIRSYKGQNNRIMLSFKDNGEGMKEDVLHRAMEPFFTTKPQGKGTGLGLSMVFGTVKAHGGTMEINSKPGSGTEVLLGLPSSENSFQEINCNEIQATPSAGNLRILLIDDDELIRDSIVPMLKLMGHQACAVDCAAKGIEKLNLGLNPDLIILDMSMPEISGLDALPLIYAINPYQNIILATGLEDERVHKARAINPSIYTISKPFTFKELETLIKSTMTVKSGTP